MRFFVRTSFVVLERRRGAILIPVLVFGGIAFLMTTALFQLGVSNIRLSRQTIERERGLQSAEAGIDYYRWHLAHAPSDYQDGTGGPGPYVHEMKDKDGTVIGTYTLDITPPPVGSTIVRMRSTGRMNTQPNRPRAIEVTLGIPSLANYAVVADDVMRFGVGTEIFGPIHSNEGIRFDGLAHNRVSSSRASYDDPDHTGLPEFGVHTHVAPVDPLPPAAVPPRPDVFEAGRELSVPDIDFAGLSGDLAQMKTDAQNGGRYYAPSGALGYRLLLKTNDTFDLYRVNTLVPPPSGCTNSANQTGWGTWSINTQTFLQNVAFPANGIIFVEDHVWVEGTIDDARLTIASGRFPDLPSTRTNIIVNNDLRYTNTDGTDVLGLIAQGNFNVGMVSDTDLRIDGALVAQNGRVGRHYYRPPGGGFPRCSPYHVRQILTLLGMIATNQRYGFAYTDGTGYQTRNINYDSNLRFGPPPSFPLTGDQYEVLSWEEIATAGN